MGNEAQKQFIAALNFLLKKEGHGSQARLARALKIDSGYLNNILKGRTPGSQEKKEKIASYFNRHYESMLSLGRWLLSDLPGGVFEAISSKILDLSKEMRDPNLCFNIAIYSLLQKMDMEALKKLSAKCDISLESLNDLLQGNSFLNLSIEKNEQIASYFNLRYESALALGNQLLTGKYPEETLQPTNNVEDWFSLIPPGTSPKKPGKDSLCLNEQHIKYQSSTRKKKDKNMLLIAEWINQQDEPDEYWTLLKIILKREEPEFKDWLKKQSSGDNQDRFPENKSAVGE